jgi:hypothetical protein
MVNAELLTNAEFGRRLGSGNRSLRFRSMLDTSIEWFMSFNGVRSDHYDCTPTTPQDTQRMLRANGGRQNWIAIPVAIEISPGQWVAGGLNTVMHGSRIGGGNPGADFPSRSNTPPPTGQSWPQGGHVCLYLVNSTGGASNETATNTHARALANQRAGTPHARGRRARAAAHEANLRSGSTTAPPATMPNVTVNYQVEVTGNPVNIRNEPSTARGQATVVGQVRPPERLNIDREQQGQDGNNITTWGRINGGKFNGMWIALRLTRRTTTPPPTPQPTPGTWSVQCAAARSNPEGSAYIDNIVARLRGMGYPNAFRCSGAGWCRARVPAGTEQQARNLTPILRDKGFGDAFPTRNI